KEKVLDLDDQIFDGKVRAGLTERLLKKLRNVTFQDMKQRQLWETGKEELKILSPEEYQRIRTRLEAEENNQKKNEARMASDEELQELLLSVNYSQNKEQYHYVLDNI